MAMPKYTNRVSLLAILLSAALIITLHEARAQACSSLRLNVDDARTQLRRAANEADFESAKNYARRAKNDLEDAELAAKDCGCPEAASEFDDAARHARRARGADGQKSSWTS
jgi:hypothetical protein